MKIKKELVNAHRAFCLVDENGILRTTCEGRDYVFATKKEAIAEMANTFGSSDLVFVACCLVVPR